MQLRHFRLSMGIVAICIPGLLFCDELCAQPANDLHFLELINRAKSIQDSLPKEAKVQYLYAWKISGNQDATKKAWLLNEIGELYHGEGSYDSSLFFFRKGLLTAVAARYAEEEVGAYQGIANNFLRLSMKDSAHIYLEKAISVTQAHKLYAAEAGLYIDLGNIYLDEKNLKEALSN